MKTTHSLLAFLNGEIIAQTKLKTLVDQGTDTILLIALLLSVVGICAASFQLFKGNIENAIYIIFACIIMASSGALSQFFFETFK